MHFELSQEQKEFQEKVREFAQNEIKPIALEYDLVQEFPWESIKKMAKLGLLGIIFPKVYGGLGYGYIRYAIAIEEVSRVCGAHGITIAAHNSLCTNHIYSFGSEEQKKKYVVPLAKGEKLGSWGLTEADAGSDAGGTKTTAKLDGDEWIINGSKMFITDAKVGEIAVVIAVTDKSKGTRGLSGFVVEKRTPGFTIGRKESKMGLRSSDTSEMIFEDCRIPKENLIGKEGEGFIHSLKILDGGRISIAAMALGLGQGVLDESIKYAKEHQRYGKPVGRFQAIQFQIADMATEIEGARLLVYWAGYLKNQGKRVSKESAMAKLFAADTAMKTAINAVKLHGACGFKKGFMVERLLRDVKLTQIGEGTSEIQKLVIARQLGL